MVAVSSGESIPIVLVTPVGAPGGAERVLAGLVRHLPELGFAPLVVLLGGGLAEEWFRDAGCPFTVIDAGGGRGQQLARLPGVIRRLRHEIRAHQAQLVVSSMAKAQLYGGIAALTTRVPDVFWQHHIPGRRRLDVAARRVPAAAVVCASDAAADAQRAQTPRALVRKVHPGIDLVAIRARSGRRDALRHDLGWDSQPAVGIVGRLEPWKGQRTFLRAAALVAERHPELQIAVVGGALIGYEGDYPQELRHLAAALGIAERTTFTGHQQDVYGWYEALDVVVHASDEPEPFGLVIVEAMALGAAVVATAGGGPLEIVEDGVSGVLVPIGDVEAMAAAVNRLVEHPDERAALGAAAVRRAEAFTEERMAKEFAAALREVLAR